MEPDREPERNPLPRTGAQPEAADHARRGFGDMNRRARPEPRQGPEAGPIAYLWRRRGGGRRAGCGCQRNAGSRSRETSSAHSRDSDVGGVTIVARVMVALVSVL